MSIRDGNQKNATGVDKGSLYWAILASMAFAISTVRFAHAQDPGANPGLPLNKPSGVEVSDRGAVEIHVADMPLSDVLQLLSLEGRRNIIASPNVKGTVTANLYGVTFEEALNAVLMTNGAGFRKVGPFIYVHTRQELQELEGGDGSGLLTRVFSLNYVNSKDAQTYLTPILGEGESVSASSVAATGLTSQATDGGGNSSAAEDFILVTARAPTMATVERVLQQIDIRPRQVLIEATIVRAELADDNALGIDFTVVGGVDLELMGSTSNAIEDIVVGDLPQSRFEQFNAAASTSFTDDVPGGGLTFGIIKDQVAVFLRALEQVTDTTVIANPKVLALNKQKGQVIVGRRDGYLTTTVTETQTVQTVEFLETGTQLIFRPFIGTDGFIRMELHPEDSVGFVNAQGLPSEQTTEVTTNVIVRDGETILIGGLFREVGTQANKQIPLLGEVPGLGWLFRSNADSTDREEVIILLTVHVVKDFAAYEEASAQIMEDIERIRVGSREGMMWCGRERLAQSNYHKALDRMAEGRDDKALWYARMALHCYPSFLPAIQLRERLLQKREWEEDGGVGRDFLRRVLAKEKASPISNFGRPPTSDEKEPESGDED